MSPSPAPDPSPSPHGAVPRPGPGAPFVVRAAALCVLLGAGAALVTGARPGSPAFVALLCASGIALAGALAGRLAGRLVPPGRPESIAQAALAGIGVRLITTAGLCFGALEAGVAPRMTFVVVVLVQYLALLVLEVAQAVADMRSAGAAPGHANGDGVAR